MKSLGKDEDVESSLDAMESGAADRITLAEGKTPIYVLSSKYADGYVHWVELPDGQIIRVVCGGGIDGKGFAPDDCLLCQLAASYYRQAKTLDKAGKEDKAKKVRARGNDVRAKYVADFIVAAGELVVIKDPRTKKKRPSADFDEAEVGRLQLTQKQYQDFVGLRSDDRYPFIKTGEDLVNRAVIVDKAKRGKSTYATLEFRPSKRRSDPPDVEWDEEDYDLEGDFEIDEERIAKAYNLVMEGKPSGKKKKAAEEEVDEDLEVDEDEEEEFEDDDLEDEEEEEEQDEFDDDEFFEDDEDEEE